MKKFIVIALMLMCLPGCASVEVLNNKKEVGTLHGALTGAIVGGAVASPTAIGIPIGAFVGGVTGLIVGDIADKNDPNYYVDKTDKSKRNVNIISGPFKMEEDDNMWYIVYDKDGQPTIAKKELKAHFWQDVK